VHHFLKIVHERVALPGMRTGEAKVMLATVIWITTPPLRCQQKQTEKIAPAFDRPESVSRFAAMMPLGGYSY
jgi:hypothetical protein